MSDLGRYLAEIAVVGCVVFGASYAAVTWSREPVIYPRVQSFPNAERLSNECVENSQGTPFVAGDVFVCAKEVVWVKPRTASFRDPRPSNEDSADTPNTEQRGRNRSRGQ